MPSQQNVTELWFQRFFILASIWHHKSADFYVVIDETENFAFCFGKQD
jgi:hypothetical protein